MSGIWVGALLVMTPQLLVPVLALCSRALKPCGRTVSSTIKNTVVPLADALDKSLRESEGIEYIYPHIPVAPSPSWKIDEREYEERVSADCADAEDADQPCGEDESSGGNSNASSVEEDGTAHDDGSASE